ncbi:MAG TPA: AAA family ATPase, partial [Isosphaeraceae bacterium]|nr:AAA family ATPase [Isosphaeraceae bacterium]
GLEFLRFGARMRGGEGLDRAVALTERVMSLNLTRKIRNFSTGMKQKLALALVFAEPVDVLILDEPTSALDPSARELVLGLVQEAKKAGQTVVFSGHVLGEVERVADRVAIMKLGRLMHVEDMHARRTRLRLVLARFDGEIPEPSESLGLIERSRTGDVVLYEHQGPVGPLLEWLASWEVSDVAIGTEDLKSLYDHYHGPDVEANGDGWTAVRQKVGAS